LKVRKLLEKLHPVEYIGPQYGDGKKLFFDSIDVLIFPSYNEAEPLIIHEAMQRALPVITYGRGCIPEIVVSECGRVIPPDKEFVPLALDQIQTWLADPALFRAASIAAAARFAALRAVNAHYWEGLVTRLLGNH
jgi:glycosyltransferase involved in cell wall biosynthesis